MLQHVGTSTRFRVINHKDPVTKAATSAEAPGGPWRAQNTVRLKRLSHLSECTRTLATVTHRQQSQETSFLGPKLIQRGLELERRTTIFGIPFANWAPSGYVILYKDQILNLQTSSDRPIAGRMKASVQILTTPTVDTPGTTVMLQCDDQRYLFGNVGEGSQRVSIEFDWKLSRITNLFLTGRVEWKSLGGLFGTILTLAESVQTAYIEKINQGKKPRGIVETAEPGEKNHKGPFSPDAERRRLSLHGGPNLTHMIATARRFIFRKGIPLDVHDLEESNTDLPPRPIWSNKHIRVWSIGLKPTTYQQTPPKSPPHSPRKRSFDEYREHAGLEGSDEAIFNDQNRQTLKAVVSQMFDSNWRLDTLIEMPLNQVRMPANVYVRNYETHRIEKLKLPEQGVDGKAPPIPDMNVLVRKPWPAALVSELPRTTPSTTATSYFVRCHSQRGKFQVEKAKALNVAPGPLFAKLSNGQTVLSRDGQEVHPKDVLDPDIPGNGFAVIDVPSPLYVKDLIRRPEWKTSEIMEGLKFVVWNIGPDVGDNEEFRNFLIFLKTMFKVEHRISSSDYSTNIHTFKSAAASAIRLHEIDALRFPHPIAYNASMTNPADRCDPAMGRIACRGWTWNLHPATCEQLDTCIPNLEISDMIKRIPPEIKALAMSVRAEITSEKVLNEIQSQGLPSPEAEIICLGTGSAQPSKYRNVSSTLLRVPGYGSYLLDCGENTLGQLRRIYNDNELAEILRDLKMIWISHLHADHHLGIVSVIKAWHRAVHGNTFISLDEYKSNMADQSINPFEVLREVKRLFIASDAAMNQWLAEYASIEDYGYDKLIPLDVSGAHFGQGLATRLMWRNTDMSFRNKKMVHAMRAATGLVDLQAAKVDHCHGAKAVSFTFSNGFKFAFSGDCRPSQDFIKIGEGCTVLLHEATFDDELQGDALAKKHSTTSEAIGAGIAMGARRILLTHFSQRYQKIPVMSSLERKAGDALREDDDPTKTEGNDVLSNAVSGDTSTEFSTDPFANDQSGREEENRMFELSRLSSLPSEHRQRRSNSNTVSDRANINNVEPVLPKMTPEKVKDLKIGVAYDYMRVKVKDIMLLERLTPAIVALMEHYEKEKEIEKERNKVVMSDRAKQKAEQQGKVEKAQKPKKSNRKESGESIRDNRRLMKTTGTREKEAEKVADATVNGGIAEGTDTADKERAKQAAVEDESLEAELGAAENVERRGWKVDEDVEPVRTEAVGGGERMEVDGEGQKPLRATG